MAGRAVEDLRVRWMYGGGRLGLSYIGDGRWGVEVIPKLIPFEFDRLPMPWLLLALVGAISTARVRF